MAFDTNNLGIIIKNVACSDSDEVRIKDTLASKINCLVDDWKLTQKEAENFLELSRSKFRELRDGQLKNFTIHSLFSLVKKLTPDIEHRLIEEYRELGLCWRHDDNWIAKLTAVLLPLSIAALTLPHLNEGAPILLCAVGGSTLMAFWFLSSRICKRRFEVRFSRIREIERMVGLDSHLRYYNHSQNPKIIFKHQRLRWWMFIGYFAIALCNTFDIETNNLAWLTDWGVFKAAITAETYTFFLIILAVFIALCLWIFIARMKNRNRI